MDGLFDGSVLPEVSFELTGNGAEGWRPLHVHVREALSSLYEASVVLAHPLTESTGLARAMGGQSLVLTIQRGTVTRRLCGFVRRVEDLGTTGGYRFARVVMVPMLWRLSQRTDCRIFQDLNVVEIVRAVLRDAGVYQGDGGVWTGTALEALAPREYCVQYNESDLDFVRRLLEDEGVPFYFRHGGDVETLVLAEDGHGWAEVPTLDHASTLPARDAGIGTASVESVQWFDVHVRDHGTGVALRDYDFSRPSAEADMTPRSPPSGPGARGVYEYRGSFTLGEYDEAQHTYGPHEGPRFARVRHEALVRDAVTGHGRSVVTGLMPGLRFALDDVENPEHVGAWLVTGVRQQGVAWGDIPDDVRSSEHVRQILLAVGAEIPGDVAHPAAQARYWNEFDSLPAAVVFRPTRSTPKPHIVGPQTARVVAEPGSDEEICVDFHGRVLVRFHWVRPELRVPSQREQRLSCWIRTAQTWASGGWGFMFIPRVGMEVVVTFLEGDPDRPLVTGCVYNGENHNPYLLPEEKTRSTLKTHSSPTTGGYNELRFEDAAGREQVYMQAERDHDVYVKHDETVTVDRDRTKVVHRDEYVTVDNNRSTTVHANDSLVVDQNLDVTVHGWTGASLTVDEGYHVRVGELTVIEVGASKITMTRDAITVQSKVINIHGENLVDIRGGLVKINCDMPRVPKGHKKPNRFERMAQKLQRAFDRIMAKLPKPVAAFLRKVGRRALRRVIDALMHGRLPDLRAMGREALAGAASGVISGVFARVAALPIVQALPFADQAIGFAQGRVNSAVQRGLAAAGLLHAEMVRDERWAQMAQGQEDAVRAMMRGVGTQVARSNVQSWSPSRNSGVPAVLLFDAMGASIARVAMV